MVSEPQKRAHKKHDATRKRYAIWLTTQEAALVDRYMKAWGLPNRIAVLRRLLFLSRAHLRDKTKQ